MLVKVGKLNYTLRMIKKRKSKKVTVNQMIEKFERLIPEKMSSVDFLKELRGKEYDWSVHRHRS